MSLSTSELQRIKAELGFSLLSTAAAPWAYTVAYFEQVVATYLQAGAATTSSTSVTAATSPTPVAITLASATGFATGNLVWIDVDERMESATIQNLSGSVATVGLSRAHSGTYRVEVDGGEAAVRDLLNKIAVAKERLFLSKGRGQLKKVDEIEWYQSGTKTGFDILVDELMFWRDELAMLLGAANMWRVKMGAGSTVAIY